MLPQGPRRRNS